jgi:hypothetical protein
MKNWVKLRPSPALVIALIALFVSIGGVSYGLATGSVNSREIKNNTIRSKDVRNNALRAVDISERSLETTLKAAFEYDGGIIESAFGGPFTVDTNGNGVETITFPFNVNTGGFHVVATSGGSGELGGTNGCIVTVEGQNTDADTLQFELLNDAGAPCNEEFTVLVFN